MPLNLGQIEKKIVAAVEHEWEVVSGFFHDHVWRPAGAFIRATEARMRFLVSGGNVAKKEPEDAPAAEAAAAANEPSPASAPSSQG